MNEAERSMPTSRGRILVLDDDVDAPDRTARDVEYSSCLVDIAHDECAALRMLQRNPYELALLNLETCGDRMVLYRTIKMICPGLVTVMVSTCTPNSADRVLTEGVWQIVARPLDVAALFQLIEGALGLPLIIAVDDDPRLFSRLRDILPDYVGQAVADHKNCYDRRRLSDGEHKVVLINTKLSDCAGVCAIYRKLANANRGCSVILIPSDRTRMSQVIQQLLNHGTDAICYKHLDPADLFMASHRTPPSNSGIGVFLNRFDGRFGRI